MDNLESTEENCMVGIKPVDEPVIEVIVKMESVDQHLTSQESEDDVSDGLQESSTLSSAETINRTLSHLFEALGVEDLADEDTRNRFIDAQVQMLQQYGSQAGNGNAEVESGIVSHNQIHSEMLQSTRSRSHSEHAAGLQLRSHRTRFSDETSDSIDEDDGEDDDGDDFLFRIQLELLMRMGLLDEDGIIPMQDNRPVLECQVCYDSVKLTLRSCCSKPVCDACLQQYVETQIVDNGNLRIGCPNPECDGHIYSDEVRDLLRMKPELRNRYDRWIVDLNGDPKRKTCPRCCHVTEIVSPLPTGRKVAKYGVLIECTECSLQWCFPCQSPWHQGMSCKKFQAGDVLLKNWAREHARGEYNAQRCPKCKVYIQRSDGCDHMTCSRCHTEFCYRCGSRRLPSLKLFGYPLEDHDLKRSIIGCNSEYKQGKPMQRALTRGALFGVKVIGGAVAVPVVAGLAAGAVGLAAGVATIALPAYGTYRLVRRIRSKRRETKACELYTNYERIGEVGLHTNYERIGEVGLHTNYERIGEVWGLFSSPNVAELAHLLDNIAKYKKTKSFNL